jgi:multiple sugar transport system substrate-binding protein
MQGAAALGATATAISSALRVAPTRAQGGTEVTFWTTYTANDLANVQAVVDGYNAQAQGSQVKLVQIPPAQVTDTTTLMTAVRGGTGPDLYLFDRFIVAQRAGDGLLQDLSSLGADQLMGNYVPFAAAESQFNGKVYCLPFDTDVRALYYNKGLLGADADKLDPANGPATWDTVAEVANKLNQQDGNGNYTQRQLLRDAGRSADRRCLQVGAGLLRGARCRQGQRLRLTVDAAGLRPRPASVPHRQARHADHR